MYGTALTVCSHISHNQVFLESQLQMMDVGILAGYKLKKEHPFLQKTGNPLVTLWLLKCIKSHIRTPCQSLDWNKGWIYLLQCKYLHILSHGKLISSCHQFPAQLQSVGQGALHPAQLRWNWENRESIFPSLLPQQI